MRRPAAIAAIGWVITVGPSFALSGPHAEAVVNSASYQDAVAQGSIFTVFGENLGPLQLQQANSYPLPYQLGGTSVSVTVHGSSMICPIIYSSSTQVAAILPSSTPLGDAAVTIGHSGGTSNRVAITVVSGGFGIYTISRSGIGPGVITGVDYAPKTVANPARRHEVLTIWGTGLGPIDYSDAEAPHAEKQPNVSVFVGNAPARILYAGRSGCCAGLDQIAFELPDGPQGCFVPVAVRSGSSVSNFVTLATSESGEACSIAAPGVPPSLLARSLAGEQVRFAAIGIGPIRVLEGAGFWSSQGMSERLSAALGVKVADQDVRRLVQAYRVKNMRAVQQILAKYHPRIGALNLRAQRKLLEVIDIEQPGVAAAFGSFQGSPVFSPQLAASFPPAGSCMVTRGLRGTRSGTLDAGASLTLASPVGQRTLPRISNGQYQVSLGSVSQNAGAAAGLYTISGNGGAHIAPFSASLSIESNLAWTNKSTVLVVDRSAPLTMTWSGGDAPGYVVMGGTAHRTGVTATFICVEDSRKGSYTIPSFVLSALPHAAASDGYLFLGRHPLSNQVPIPGVDVAYVVDAGSDYKSLEFH